MADVEEIQPLVCDNGTGMVKVKKKNPPLIILFLHIILFYIFYLCSKNSNI